MDMADTDNSGSGATGGGGSGAGTTNEVIMDLQHHLQLLVETQAATTSFNCTGGKGTAW
jgi:hypothetical protein